MSDKTLNLKTDILWNGEKRYLVSTVDLWDIKFYETMVFAYINDEVYWSDLYCERYSTPEEATERHNELVDILSNNFSVSDL